MACGHSCVMIRSSAEASADNAAPTRAGYQPDEKPGGHLSKPSCTVLAGTQRGFS